jgi:hypothetical protein
VADHSRDQRNRDRVSRSGPPKTAPDSTPAATHSLGDRIATGDHTPGAPRSFAAKRHTELRAAAVATDRNQMAGRRRLLAWISTEANRPNGGDRLPIHLTQELGF